MAKTILFTLLLFVLAACGGNDDPTPQSQSPSVEIDTGFLDASAISASEDSLRFSGEAKISVDLQSAAVELIGCNLLLRLDGSRLVYNQNINARPAVIAGVSSSAFEAKFSVSTAATTGFHRLEYRWLCSWVGSDSKPVVVPSFSTRYSLTLD